MDSRWRFAVLATATTAVAAGLGAYLLAKLPPDPPLPGVTEADLRALEDALSAMPSLAVEADADSPDVVVIVLDTLRQDRIPLYGYERPTMPMLTEWAEDALVYDEARSVTSWTLPSHASLFTGQYPIDHGAHGKSPEAYDGGHDAYRLPDDATTLAERARDVGYRTWGIAANRAYLSRNWGLNQGFDLWLCEQLDNYQIGYPTAERVTDLALRALDERGDEPVFLFLNYMDAHTPYFVRDGHRMSDAPLYPRFQHDTRAYRLVRRLVLLTGWGPAPVLRAWSDAYDADVSYLDLQVGRLLDGLEARGIDENDYVVILSDHGEYFGEHGLVTHSKGLHDEVVRVPLIVRGPGFPAGRSDALVQTQDVPRWLTEKMGAAPLPDAEATGERQVTELYWTRRREMELSWIGHRFNHVLRGFSDGQRTVTLSSRGEVEAFDGHGSAPLDETWVEPLRSWGERWMADREVTEGAQAAEDDVEALRSLGYMD
ncbi:MAG: hypothetical protein EP330_31365 [Deltaproteobacteria bacterium]|nr:MAG: hypothetical protein EP330_31365 [Deltaproteobacteria bacterium]